MRSRRQFLQATLPGVHAGAFIAAIVFVHFLAAWFNAGYPTADEHYQIIEFAQYKLGYQQTSALAWEFAAQIRPALQPALAALAIRLHHALGVASPFAIAFSLRVLSALLAVWVTLELCVRCLPSIETRWVRRVALYASFFLWVAPSVHARFSSDNWGGLWFVAGLCLMLDAADDWEPRRARSMFLAVCTGAIWSAAFYCRFQMGIAIAGAGLWLLLMRRGHLALVAAIAASFVAGGAFNEGLDHWLYGVWTYVPWNYFASNLIEGKAATFGVLPWWMIGVYAAVALIPPFSLVIIAVVAVGSWYARRHVIVWTAMPFVFMHVAVAHKEARFLIPLVYIAGVWGAVCLDALPSSLKRWITNAARTALGRASIAMFCTVNVLALVAAVLLPANDSTNVDRWRWEHRELDSQAVYASNPVTSRLPPNVTNSFYRGEVSVSPPPFTTVEDIAAKGRTPVFVYYKGFDAPASLQGRCEPVVRAFPMWLAGRTVFQRMAIVEQATICRLDLPAR
jgi:phosphatidylinositol glycan class B